MLVSEKNALQPISLFDTVIENFPNSLAHNSVLIRANNYNISTETRCMVQRSIRSFNQLVILCKVMFFKASYAHHLPKSPIHLILRINMMYF